MAYVVAGGPNVRAARGVRRDPGKVRRGGPARPRAGQVPAPALRALPRDGGQPRGRVVPKRAGRKASAR